MPFAQIPWEPRLPKEIKDCNDSGGHWQTKPVTAYLTWMTHGFTRDVFADRSIWAHPSTSNEPVKGCAGNRWHNLTQAARGWALFQHVPDIDDFGKSIPGLAFIKKNGNFMVLLRQLEAKHVGEGVEVPGTEEWCKVAGEVPTDKLFWHAQFAETQEHEEVLRKVGALGSMLATRKKEQVVAYLAGSPHALGEQMEQLTCLTHAQFNGSWRNSGFAVRKANIVTLMQVLMLDPVHVTMQEAYAWYCQRKKICKKKLHSPKITKRVSIDPPWWATKSRAKY